MSRVSISTIKIVEFLERKNTGAIVIDIRTPEEIKTGKIADAREMDFYDIGFEQQVRALNISHSYLIYCRLGHRSKQALEIFLALGFQDVHDLEGGIGTWLKTGNALS